MTDSATQSTQLDGLEALFVAAYDPVLRFFQARLSDVATAEDLTAETFMRARRRWPPTATTLDGRRVWLFKIARHLWIDHWRQQQRRPTDALDETLAQASDEQPGAGRHLDALTVRMAFDQLSQFDQQLISLRLAGLSNREVAVIVGKSSAAVAMGMMRALRRLQTQVEAQHA